MPEGNSFRSSRTGLLTASVRVADRDRRWSWVSAGGLARPPRAGRRALATPAQRPLPERLGVPEVERDTLSGVPSTLIGRDANFIWTAARNPAGDAHVAYRFEGWLATRRPTFHAWLRAVR